jgi:hypothetical protein
VGDEIEMCEFGSHREGANKKCDGVFYERCYRLKMYNGCGVWHLKK